MRIFGLAFVLLGALLSFASAQTPQADPGDYLLRAVKAVADSGRANDSATVSALMHLSLAQTGHSVWGAAGECPGGGRRIDDTYAVTGDNWFHPLPSGKQHMIIQYLPQLILNPNGKQTEAPLGDPQFSYDTRGVLHCAQPSQNEVGADINFNNIPAYACISKAQIESIFPNLGPGDEVTDAGWGPDFAYSENDTRVNFQMTLRPGVTDPHHQLVCLMDLSLFSRSQFGSLHEPDLSFIPPVPSEVGAIVPSPSDQPLPPNTGTYLLRAVKAVTDSGRADDPATVAKMLHISLSAGDYENDGVISCLATSAMQGHVSLYFVMAGKSWFHALPTGKRVLVKGFPAIDAIELANMPIDDPAFSYNIGGQVGCTKSPSDSVVGQITFDNIPPYACISTLQIKSVFPGAHHPTDLPSWQVVDLRYSNANTDVDFTMTSSDPRGVPNHQPVCLKTINVGASYPWGGFHKLDVGT
jgi:hypothetical protein